MRSLPVIVGLGFASGAAIAAGMDAAGLDVHQSSRQFAPTQLTMARGGAVHFFNDETIVHHAFVDTRTFAADTGDIPPGESRDIVFTETGMFVIRCAIHPTMRMSVQVTD
jgi:plastocyanin